MRTDFETSFFTVSNITPVTALLLALPVIPFLSCFTINAITLRISRSPINNKVAISSAGIFAIDN
jgi:hypothetical protein